MSRRPAPTARPTTGRTLAALITPLALWAAAGAAGAQTPAPGFAPAALWRGQAYEGPTRPAAEVAIVFAMDGRPRSESSSICIAGGWQFQRDGRCATVVYLPPGEHDLGLLYQSATEQGVGGARIRVEAGRVYQVNVTSLRTGGRGLVNVWPMAPGHVVTWRNIAPGLAAGSPRIDEAVPVEGTAPGEALPK